MPRQASLFLSVSPRQARIFLIASGNKNSSGCGRDKKFIWFADYLISTPGRVILTVAHLFKMLLKENVCKRTEVRRN